ncbi:MAG: cytidine deaminase [Gemmatimonadota bacterium]
MPPADTTADLTAQARLAQSRAYAPYSGYRVGAALEGADGHVFLGCNVENASYSVTCCAEQVAVFNAIAAGVRDFRRMVISASGTSPYPCGACRQVLSEFAPTLPVTVVADDGTRHDFTLDTLLPNPFVLAGEGRPA